jgi:hypothetical protein
MVNAELGGTTASWAALRAATDVYVASALGWVEGPHAASNKASCVSAWNVGAVACLRQEPAASRLYIRSVIGRAVLCITA